MKFSLPASMIKSTIGLFIITIVLKVAGYGEKLVLAYYFGTSSSADSYVLILTILLSFFYFFREVSEPVVLNVFMRSEEEEAWSLFNYVIRILFGISLAIFVTGFFFPEYAVEIFAPGFDEESKATAIKLFQIAVPAIIFLSLSTITNIVFNAQKIFVFPSIGDVAFKILSIVCIILFTNQFGIVSGAVGILLGAIVKLSLHLTKLYNRVSFSRVHVSNERKKQMWLLAWPLIIGMFFSQLTGVVDNLFASYMEKGSIAALSYARKIIELPIMIFPYILSVVIFPYFTQLSIEKDHQRSMQLLVQSLRWIVIVFIPLSIYFSYFSHHIVQLIFKRGAFDEHSTILTADPLLIYSIGLLFFAVESVLVIFYFANADTKTPIFVGIACVVINIVATYLLIPYVGYLSIAIALVLQKGLKVCILGSFISKKISVPLKALIGFTVKLVIPVVIFLVSIAGVKYLLLPIADKGVLMAVLLLSTSFLIGGVLYVTSLFVVGLVKRIDFVKFHLS